MPRVCWPLRANSAEFISIQTDVPLEDVEGALYGGAMHLPSAFSGLLALKYLRTRAAERQEPPF
jgi:hypothetical protein